MEWDMKSGSSPWDWDNNAMLFPGIGLSRTENISNGGSNSASAPAPLAVLTVAATAAAAENSINNVGRGSFGAAADRGRVFGREEKSSVVVARAMEDMKEPKQGDSLVDLKLGRRSDYEDGMGMGGKTIAVASVVSPVPSKKPRGSMQGAQTPCCQVQGCNADLKCCKDYHRRHKVCEMHSKSAKVRVAGLEQRFCQQCSRFHLLSEFDEGKRSCRKRLAGHNERRRKHQPGSVMKSARLLPTFHDNGRPGNILADSSSFMYPSFVSRSVLDDSSDFKLSRGNWPRVVKQEYQSTYDGRLQVPGVDRQTYFSTLPRHNAGRLLPFLQGPKTVPSDSLNHGIDQYTESGRGPICQALTLSSSSGSGVLSGLEIASTAQGLPGVSDSRCALSLLSSQPWSSRAPGSASLNMATRSGIPLDQIMLDNQPPMAQPLMPGLQSNYGLVADKLLRISSRSSTSLFSSKFSATGINVVDEEQLGGVLVSSIGGVGTFEGPGHSFLQGPNFRDSEGEISQDVRRTIDLMCMSSQPQTAEFQEQSGAVQKVQFADFQLMKPYDSSFLDAQKML